MASQVKEIRNTDLLLFIFFICMVKIKLVYFCGMKMKIEDSVNGRVSEYVNAYIIRLMNEFISDTNII